MQFREPAPAASDGAGLRALIRWSDRGEEAVKGGRYRFLSPVWSRDDCQTIENTGSGRINTGRMAAGQISLTA